MRTCWFAVIGGPSTCGRGRRAIDELKAAQRRYLASGFEIDDPSGSRPLPKNAMRCRECSILLDALEHACRAFHVAEEDRGYRQDFTPNYRALFPEGKRRRLYRVDILQAAQEEIGAIWVNGERYVFPAEVFDAGVQLHRKWTQLMNWLSAVKKGGWQTKTIAEFVQVMIAFDETWVKFEEAYVKKLISIEESAKRIIVEAVELEAKLSSATQSVANPSDGSDVLKQLVEVINRLNSIGNVEGKGRADLSVDILNFVYNGNQMYPELKCLGAAVIQSFNDLRCYFQSIADRLDLVDPHLGNNGMLVQLLGVWEETWEIGKKFLIDDNMRVALVSFLRHVRVICLLDKMQDFAEKLLSCEAEALWVLPKLAILQYVASPQSDYLCKEFMPECWINDDALHHAIHYFTFLPPGILRDLYPCCVGYPLPELPPECKLDEFWINLEKTSTGLQRLHPLEWNRFAMVFTRCFSQISNFKIITKNDNIPIDY